jgi:hypothetical protein
MSIVDPVQNAIEAAVAIINADTELRTLFGRTSQLIVPWESLADAPSPVIAYAVVFHSPAWTNTARLQVQFASFGATSSVVNKAAARVALILTYTAFAARGLEVARDPESLPARSWPDASPLVEDASIARADITLSFIITG